VPNREPDEEAFEPGYEAEFGAIATQAVAFAREFIAFIESPPAESLDAVRELRKHLASLSWYACCGARFDPWCLDLEGESGCARLPICEFPGLPYAYRSPKHIGDDERMDFDMCMVGDDLGDIRAELIEVVRVAEQMDDLKALETLVAAYDMHLSWAHVGPLSWLVDCHVGGRAL